MSKLTFSVITSEAPNNREKVKEEPTTGKPLASKLTYEFADDSVEYEDGPPNLSENLETLLKSNIDFEEAEESIYHNPSEVIGSMKIRIKVAKGTMIQENRGDISTDVSPIDSEEMPIPSPGKFAKAYQLDALTKKELLKPSGKLRMGNMIKPKGMVNTKK